MGKKSRAKAAHQLEREIYNAKLEAKKKEQKKTTTTVIVSVCAVNAPRCDDGGRKLVVPFVAVFDHTRFRFFIGFFFCHFLLREIDKNVLCSYEYYIITFLQYCQDILAKNVD